MIIYETQLINSRNTGRKVKAIYGKESSEYLTRLIGGKKVRLEYDVDHFDQYGRTLTYVYLLNGIFVNAYLVKNGYAILLSGTAPIRFRRDAMHGVSTF